MDDLEIGRVNLALAKRQGDANQVVSTAGGWGLGGTPNKERGMEGDQKHVSTSHRDSLKKTEG